MKPNEQARSAWNVTLVLSLMSLFCSVVLSWANYGKINPIAMSFAFGGVVNFISLIVLFFNRKNKSEKVSLGLYLLNVCCFGLAVFYNQEYWLQGHPSASIFFGYKAMAVIIAIQGPRPKWVGFVCLNYLILLLLFQFYSWPVEVRQNLSLQEPWFSFTLIGACQFMYMQRVKIFEIYQRNIELETSTKQLRHFAEILLGIQHLANSPLQVIESATDLIEMKHPEAKDLAQKIKQAAQPIKMVCQQLSVTKSHLHWNEFTLTGGIDELKNELGKLTQQINHDVK